MKKPNDHTEPKKVER